MLSNLPLRIKDDYGYGHFGASRGDREHTGQDYACYPGTRIISHVTGMVTKLGHAYADDLSYRYVQVSDADGHRHRFFYVDPAVELQDIIHVGYILGTSQDICARYPINQKHPKGMINHVHYEIMDTINRKKFYDPSNYVRRF